MKEIYPNLYIGNDMDCKKCANDSNFAIVHACKTCHQSVLGYTKSLPSAHPNYLIFETDCNLYLNLVDMPAEFHPKFTHPIFDKALGFISKHITKHKVLIHCNQGGSRSASLGLVYLAQHGIIANNDFEIAMSAFLKRYPDYKPGNGVRLYTKNNWNYLIRRNS